jgi:hypothetical protein
MLQARGERYKTTRVIECMKNIKKCTVPVFLARPFLKNREFWSEISKVRQTRWQMARLQIFQK